ncbi:MAG TPA: hypothetical protein VGR87_14180 [Candidatus Limnocylindria bacterium]|nr:hypothetical protein [Candidatus Limnocylindria bacterium]
MILVLALAVLPFQDRSSAEFVVTVLALLIGVIFVGIVTIVARSTVPPHPRSSGRKSVDKATRKD